MVGDEGEVSKFIKGVRADGTLGKSWDCATVQDMEMWEATGSL